MSNFLIAIICGAAAAAWTYNKFMKTTGSNINKAVGGGVMLGFLAFLAMLVILSFVN